MCGRSTSYGVIFDVCYLVVDDFGVATGEIESGPLEELRASK